MEPILIQRIYYFTLLLYTITEVILIRLNLKSALSENINLPESLKKLQNQEIQKKKFNYIRQNSNLQTITTIYSSILLFIFIHFEFFGKIDSYLRLNIQHYYLRALTFIFVISVIFFLLNLPFSLYSTFVIEEKFGFNKMTFKLWLIDLFKGTLLALIISTPILLGILYFIESYPDYWWVYAFLLFAGFQTLLMLIFPSFIAPIFNKFEKLQDEKLGEEINRLAESLEFETQGIYQIDGSKRSTHGNAYFAGFGKGRRIVLFDTLIEKLNTREICAVLAHEIGHAKKRHIIKSLILSFFFILLSFYVAFLLIDNESFFKAFGLKETSPYSLLILISIAFEPILYFISPLFSSLSRKNEYEADRFAVDSVGNASDLENALAKLSTESLSNLNPHPLYSFIHYSHPTLLERIKAMKKYEDLKVKVS